MKQRMQMRYPASAATVLRMMTQVDFHTAKLQRLGISGYQLLDQQRDAERFSVRIRRRVPIEVPVPALLQKLVPAQLLVVHEDRWTLADARGEVIFEFQGLPLQLACCTALQDADGGCVLSYDWEVQAKVPMVGGAVEMLLLADLEKKLAAETRVGIELLARFGDQHE